MINLLERGPGIRENLSAFDASYVALAEALECALLWRRPARSSPGTPLSGDRGPPVAGA